VLLIAAEVSASSTTPKVTCENIENGSDWAATGVLKACRMKQSTAITAKGYEISNRDASVKGLEFFGNVKILFLPNRVNEAFPDLVGYLAWSCSLTTISRENFKNLSKVKLLGLQGNQITTIHSDTFMDLISLEVLHLGEQNYFILNLSNILNLRNQQNQKFKWTCVCWFEQTETN
jgi:hypothetical protein